MFYCLITRCKFLLLILVAIGLLILSKVENVVNQLSGLFIFELLVHNYNFLLIELNIKITFLKYFCVHTKERNSAVIY